MRNRCSFLEVNLKNMKYIFNGENDSILKNYHVVIDTL